MEMKKEQQNENEEQINKNSQLMISVVGCLWKKKESCLPLDLVAFVLVKKDFRKNKPRPMTFFNISIQKRSKPPIDIPPN